MTYQEKREIKICFWVFLFLLLTEGIFRRWLFPGLNNLFLVARDPFVLYVIFVGIRAGLLRDMPGIIMLGLSVLCFLSAMIFGHGNIIVAMYGMRILLYFPFIFITATVLSRNDILKVGRIFVLLIIPMTLLCMVQFVSPQSSFVNIGVGGDEGGAGFGGALGYYRPPGIFTFTAALIDYYAISLSFLLYFLTNKRDARKMHLPMGVLIASVLFYIISIPVSISRTHFVQTILICSFYLFAFLNEAKIVKKIFIIVTIIVMSVLIAVLMVPDIDLYTKVFLVRFESANTSEGGLLASAYERIFGWAIRAWNKTPFLGYGDGYFTNVGMKILQGDTYRYTGELAKIADATEMEWGRVLCEDGIILGSFILLTRFFISFDLFFKARTFIYSSTNQLPWLLLPFTMYQLFFGQLKASYHVGFFSIITISCVVAIRDYQKDLFILWIKYLLRKYIEKADNVIVSNNV